MKAFTAIKSRVIPLPIKDVDTDMIIPAQYLTSVSRGGYGQHLFERLKSIDPHFPFNNQDYKAAKILLAESNFGCGSSREHAVWALQDAGIEVIIAISYSDIFYNNSAKNGLLLITLPENTVRDWLQRAQSETPAFNVDLQTQTLSTNRGEFLTFDYDPFRKNCLLNGFDDLDYLLSHRNEIDTYFQTCSTAP